MTLVKLKKSIRTLAVVFAALCCLMFVLATLDEAKSRHHLEEFLADVNVDDGINKIEAESIASAYYSGFVGACGGTDEGTVVGGDWLVPASFGMAGHPMPPIRINAKTGAVSQLGNPSFSSYGTFKVVLLWGIPMRKLTYFVTEYYYDHWASPDEVRQFP